MEIEWNAILCEYSRVLPVRVDQEACERAVGLAAGVEAAVFPQRHLDPNLVARNQVEHRAARQ